MSKIQNKIVRVCCGVIVLSIVLFKYIFHVSLPQYSGEKQLPGIDDSVEVFFDEYAAPHVFATNEKDLFYVSGYLMARERLFQLSLAAASGRGELSLFIGDDKLSSDIYLRTFGIPFIAKEMDKRLDDKTRKLLSAYCQGINDWIDESENNWPVEFRILRSKPIKWKTSDVIAFSRLMAYELQQSWKGEIIMGAMVEQFGIKYAKALFPNDPDDIMIASPYNKMSAFYNKISREEKKIRSLIGMDGTVMGSNSWVVNGEKTESGKPILSNDPHLGTKQPSWWYEMHLKGGEFNISGACLPGMPIPIIGQNENAAWGFTNIMIDDMDFFIETIHPEYPNKYKHDDTWKDITVRSETIKLKSGADTTIMVRSTHHGPIISDIHDSLKNSKKQISMTWAGHFMSDELPTLIKMATIKNWDDFSNAVKTFSVPGQNIIYADINGNIGWRPAVKIPIRKNAKNLLPRPGEDSSYDWEGFVPFNEMPFLLNPEKGFIATANNKTIGDSFPYYISNQWASPSRIKRIEQMIMDRMFTNVDFMQEMQMDQKSHLALEIVNHLLQTKSNGNELINKGHSILSEWDFIESPDSKGALVYHYIFNALLKNTYGDEMKKIGENYLIDFVNQPMVPVRSMISLLRTSNSIWFDDINTNEIESKVDILKKSIVDGIMLLEKDFGKNEKNWKWSTTHTITQSHAMGSQKILNILFDFNLGPFPSGGSSGSINKAEYKLLKDFDVAVAPSMRRIVDFNNLNETKFILPGGQSGLQNSPHYKNQSTLYKLGKYRTTYFDENYIRLNMENKLVLLPNS